MPSRKNPKRPCSQNNFSRPGIMTSNLAVVPLCSRPVFSSRGFLRVINHDDLGFIGVNDITRQKIQECPILAELKAIDPVPYLAEYMGIPGIVKGVCHYGSGMLVFSENLKYFTRVCSSRVTGNKIKFNYGSEEFKEDRANCWQFCVKLVRMKIIKNVKRSEKESFPLILSRETNCPICYETLTCQNVSCEASHQTCLSCFNLLPLSCGVKKCPLCNKPNYTPEELEKAERMNGKTVESEPYFLACIDSGANSFKDYTYNEALFFGMIKIMTNNGLYFDRFSKMLMSGLYNYYITHKEAFSDYSFNILNQIDGNSRTWNPFKDDVNIVIEKYIDSVLSTDDIYNDVAHTQIYMSEYDDIEFYSDLEFIDGNMNRIKDYPNDRKEILKREIFFRSKIKRTNANELKEIIKDVFKKILDNSNRYLGQFEIIKIET